MPTSGTTPPAPPSRLRSTIALCGLALLAGGAYLFHLQSRVAELDAPEVAGTQPAEAPVAPLLSPEQAEAMVSILQRQRDAGRTAWFQVQRDNARTAALLGELRAIFEQAGWQTQVVHASYPLKRGVFLLAADSVPPGWVDAVSEGFVAAGLEVPYLTGYRDFVRERKNTNPDWVGPELAGDQEFCIAIGGPPAPLD